MSKPSIAETRFRLSLLFFLFCLAFILVMTLFAIFVIGATTDPKSTDGHLGAAVLATIAIGTFASILALVSVVLGLLALPTRKLQLIWILPILAAIATIGVALWLN